MQINILIVDDDRDICEYVKMLLAQNGYTVDALNDPTKVIDTLRSKHYHMVILDLMMPQVSGLEVLNQIREIDDDIAIVIFTAHPSVDSAVISLQQNVSDYIKKPFDVDEFVMTIERVLKKKGLLVDPEEELHATIGRSVREKRKASGLTLRQMSNRTGLSVSLLSQIERAESSASVSSLFKLANAMGCKITSFFGNF
ncbi:MAG: response regulator [Bradymonadales bacterium]|nr:response regulator [Bradymonadales bacterium]